MLEVYADPCTINSHKALAGLDLIGTEFHLNHVNYFIGEHKGDEYLKVNPHGTVPAAVDGDCHITESNAILQYAADVADSKYYPKDFKHRAAVNRWLLWETSVWFPSCYVSLIENVVQPLLKQEPSQEKIDAEHPRWSAQARILDTQLAKTKWIAGNDLTIADIAIAAPMHLWRESKLPIDDYKNLRRWIGQVESLESWKKTQIAVETALVPAMKQNTKRFPTEESETNGHTNGASTGTSNGTTLKPAIDGFPHEVVSTFNYSKPGLTEIYFYECDAAKKAREPGDDPHEVKVTNGWDRVNEYTSDKNGFSLHHFKTSYSKEWEDEDSVKKEFYPDVVEFLKKAVGAKDVMVFDHTIRTNKNANKPITQETNTSQRAPVMLVHCDYTSNSAPLRVSQLLPDTPFAKYLSSSDTTDSGPHSPCANRYTFINVWLPVHNPVYNNPLAMLDHKSTVPSDFQVLHLRYRDRNGENYVLKHREGHDWVYFPGMSTDQCVLLKTFDSERGQDDCDEKSQGQRARWVAHSAFKDPSGKDEMPARESVEIRTIAFF